MLDLALGGSELHATHLSSLCELESHKDAISRFGTGLKAILAIARIAFSHPRSRRCQQPEPGDQREDRDCTAAFD